MRFLKKNNYVFVIIILTLSIISCERLPKDVRQTLKLAGENSNELQAVIDQYQKPKDSLKLKAAYFLIGNMDTKFSYDTLAIGPHRKFIKILDSFNSIPLVKKRKMKWWYDNTPSDEKYDLDVWYPNGLHWHPDFKDSIWNSLNSKHGQLNFRSLPVIMDIDVIKSDLLIENIDLAFKVWQEKPWAKHVNFENFCEFILPYRVANEPLSNWRAKLLKKYGWIDTIRKNNDVIHVAKTLNDSLQWFKNHDLFNEYPDLGIMDMYKTKSGICIDQNNLANYVLRSQGVPIIHVLKNKATSWSAILDTDQKLVEFDGAFEAPNKSLGYMQKHMLSEAYKLTKVMAHSYAKTKYPFSNLPKEDVPPLFRLADIKDVTSISQATNKDLKIKVTRNLEEEFKYVYLCHFESDKLEAIDWSEFNKEQVTFQSVGTNKIYLPAFYKNEHYIPAGYPFYFKEDGTLNTLIPIIENKRRVRLFRKYGMGFRETKYAKLMIGGKFQGSNDRYFKNAMDIFTINDMPKYSETKKTNVDDKFQFVRYISNPKGKIAEIGFYNAENEKLTGEFIWSKDIKLADKIEHVFDNDIRTNFSQDGVLGDWWIGLDLGRPTQLSKISYLFRNSFNSIELGHVYELFYWDNEWISLGIKKALNEYLDYDVPQKSLLRLVNLTEGIDQMVFFIKDGEQVWG